MKKWLGWFWNHKVLAHLSRRREGLPWKLYRNLRDGKTPQVTASVGTMDFYKDK